MGDPVFILLCNTWCKPLQAVQGSISVHIAIQYFFSAICNDNAMDFEVLDQIAELEEILTLNMISSKHEKLFDVSALKQERNTWRLIGRLYHDELMQAQNANDSGVMNILLKIENYSEVR